MGPYLTLNVHNYGYTMTSSDGREETTIDRVWGDTYRLLADMVELVCELEAEGSAFRYTLLHCGMPCMEAYCELTPQEGVLPQGSFSVAIEFCGPALDLLAQYNEKQPASFSLC